MDMPYMINNNNKLYMRQAPMNLAMFNNNALLLNNNKLPTNNQQTSFMLSGKDRARMLFVNLFGRAPSSMFAENMIRIEPSFQQLLKYSGSTPISYFQKPFGDEVNSYRNNALTPQIPTSVTPIRDAMVNSNNSNSNSNATKSESSPMIDRLETGSRKSDKTVSTRNDSEMPKRMTNRMRITCDRCTRLKTKCNKEEGSDSCIRCTKGGYCCVFTCQRKRGRVPKKELEQYVSSSNGLVEMNKMTHDDHDGYSTYPDSEVGEESINGNKRSLDYDVDDDVESEHESAKKVQRI